MQTFTTPYASASLYVGDLAREVTEALLFEIFNAVGPVASVRVCRDAATRLSLGYAYVNFHRVEDAERALDTMNFRKIRGRTCRIMWSHRDPSLRKSGLGNIFVKNLAPNIDNKTLYDTFSMFGNILSCKVAANKGVSLGYGFVHYESEEAGQNAIKNCDGKVIAGKKVSVAQFKSRIERNPGNRYSFTNLYVKNLPDDYCLEQMNQMFGKFGEIASSVTNMDKSGKGRFGFVDMKRPEDAKVAIESLHGLDLPGSKEKLFVARHKRKDERLKEIRNKFDKKKIENQRQYHGVNLYVKNLADTIDEKRLEAEFSQFGPISSSAIMRDNSTKSKGFGFVCFKTPDAATKAVTEMNGRMIENKPLYVAIAQRRAERRAQLEAQYAARVAKFVPPQMYPTPIFYPGMPQRPVMYPQQMMPSAGHWNPRAPQMIPRFQLMPLPGQRGGGMMSGQRGGGRGRGGRGRGGMEARQGQVQYTPNVRNVQQQGNVPQTLTQQPMPDTGTEPFTLQALLAAPEEQKKQMIGERLFPEIKKLQPVLAGKITGMLLEMDNGELIHLLESPTELKQKVGEALQVLSQSENYDDADEEDEEDEDDQDDQ